MKDKDDLAAIKKATDELSQTIQKIGQAMYKDQKPPQGQPGAQPGDQGKADGKAKAKSDKGPVEADYEEVKK